MKPYYSCKFSAGGVKSYWSTSEEQKAVDWLCDNYIGAGLNRMPVDEITFQKCLYNDDCELVRKGEPFDMKPMLDADPAIQEKCQPKVGDGATEVMYSDRHAYTIIKVNPHSLLLQRDIATRTDNNGMSESQSYDYKRDEHGSCMLARQTKHGWKYHSSTILVGVRREYYDYSF